MAGGQKYNLFAVGLVFILIVVNVGLAIQQKSIKESANLTSNRFSYTLRSQAAALHLLNYKESNDFGSFSRAEYEDVTRNCGINKIPGINSQNNQGSLEMALPPIKLVTDNNRCENSHLVAVEPVLLGLEVKRGGGSQIETVKIG